MKKNRWKMYLLFAAILFFGSGCVITTTAIDKSIEITEQKKRDFIRLKEPIKNLYDIWPARSAFIKEWFGGAYCLKQIDPRAYEVIKKLDHICALAKDREFTDVELAQGAALFIKYKMFIVKGLISKYAPKALKLFAWL